MHAATTDTARPEKGRCLVVMGRSNDVRGDADPLLGSLANSGWTIDAAVPVADSTSLIRWAHAVWGIPWPDALKSFNARHAVNKKLRAIVAQGDYDAILSFDPLSALVGRTSLPKRMLHGARMVYACQGFHTLTEGSAIRRYVLWLLEFFATKRTDTLIVFCPDDLEIARRLSTFSRCTILEMPGLGIDSSPTPTSSERIIGLRELFEVAKDEKLACVPFSFVEEARRDFLIDLASEIAHRGSKVRLVFSGTGPLESSTRELVRARGLGSVVRFAGERPADDDLVAVADVILAVSVRGGSRRRIAEYMLAGTPCIRGAFPELESLVSEPDAIPASAGVESIVDLVERITNDASLARSLAEKQSARMKSECIVGVIAPQIEKLLVKRSPLPGTDAIRSKV